MRDSNRFMLLEKIVCVCQMGSGSKESSSQQIFVISGFNLDQHGSYFGSSALQTCANSSTIMPSSCNLGAFNTRVYHRLSLIETSYLMKTFSPHLLGSCYGLQMSILIAFDDL